MIETNGDIGWLLLTVISSTLIGLIIGTLIGASIL